MVFTWANYAYAYRNAFGNNLADYADTGGVIILGQWCLPTAGNYLGGRIMNPAEGYLPVTGTSYPTGTFTYAGPDYGYYTAGVESWTSPYQGQRHASARCQVDCYYSDDVPLVAISCGPHPPGVFYTPGVFASEGAYGESGDNAALIANAPLIGCPICSDCNRNHW